MKHLTLAKPPALRSAERRTRQASRRRAEDDVAAINGVAADLAIHVPRDAHTLDGFRRWALSDEFPKRGRISFIGGEVIIDMSPEELFSHNVPKVEFTRAVANLNAARDRGIVFADRALITNVAAELSNEPECSFVSYESILSGRVKLLPRKDESGPFMEILGSADWVLEIVSRSSVTKDTKLLRKRYHMAEVREYWLIDARGKKINFQILIWNPDGYGESKPRGGWLYSPVFDSWFKLDRKKNKVGFWQYRLSVKDK